MGEVRPPGLSVGVTTVSLLPAKTVGVPLAKPPSTSFFGFVVSADRKTSAGAPCSIWVSRADELSVETVSVVPGFAASYAVFALSSAPFSDAAPKTVRLAPAPPPAACDAADGRRGGWAVDAPPLEQAATTSATRMAANSQVSRRVTNGTPSPMGSRRSRWWP